MTNEEYAEKAIRTMVNPLDGDMDRRLNDSKSLNLLHAGMGLVTESAEFMDALKKYIAYGDQLDLVNLKEELGDLMWYVQLALNNLNANLSDVMTLNIKKLEKRYPNGFDKVDAKNRDLDSERDILEGKDDNKEIHSRAISEVTEKSCRNCAHLTLNSSQHPCNKCCGSYTDFSRWQPKQDRIQEAIDRR